MDATNILIAFIGVISSILTYFIIPYLRTKINTEKWEQIQKVAFVATNAAEQLSITKVIKDKYEYAKSWMESELEKLNIKINEAEIKAAIEAAVRQNFPKK